MLLAFRRLALALVAGGVCGVIAWAIARGTDQHDGMTAWVALVGGAVGTSVGRAVERRVSAP